MRVSLVLRSGPPIGDHFDSREPDTATDGGRDRHRSDAVSPSPSGRAAMSDLRVLEHPMCGNPAGSGSGNHSVCQVPEHELGGSR